MESRTYSLEGGGNIISYDGTISICRASLSQAPGFLRETLLEFVAGSIGRGMVSKREFRKKVAFIGGMPFDSLPNPSSEYGSWLRRDFEGIQLKGVRELDKGDCFVFETREEYPFVYVSRRIARVE